MIFDKLHDDYIKKFNELPSSETKTEVYNALITTEHFGWLKTKYANFLEDTLLKENETILDMMKDVHIQYQDNKSSFGESGIKIKGGWSL